MGKLRSREGEGCAEGAGLELGWNPGEPPSSASGCPQLSVSVVCSWGCSVGTWDCGRWQRRGWTAKGCGGARQTAGVTVESSLRPGDQWCLDTRQRALHPNKAVLWLVGMGELSWGYWSPGSPHLLPHRTCTLSASQVVVTDQPTSVRAQHGSGQQAQCQGRPPGAWLQGPKRHERD